MFDPIKTRRQKKTTKANSEKITEKLNKANRKDRCLIKLTNPIK